jgi:Flp pilus assembly protein TadG
MTHPRTHRPRRGASALEAALILPVLFLLLLGLIVGGRGVFHYEQVACLSREAARFAAVQGADYAAETGQASPTEAQIRDRAVLPLAMEMDPARLTVTVQFVDKANGTVTAWDGASKAPSGQTASGDTVTNAVRVTVTYQWSARPLLSGPLTLASTSEMPLAY